MRIIWRIFFHRFTFVVSQSIKHKLKDFQSILNILRVLKGIQINMHHRYLRLYMTCIYTNAIFKSKSNNLISWYASNIPFTQTSTIQTFRLQFVFNNQCKTLKTTNKPSREQTTLAVYQSRYENCPALHVLVPSIDAYIIIHVLVLAQELNSREFNDTQVLY